MSLSTSAFITSSDFAMTIACFHSSGAGSVPARDEARAEIDARRAEHQRRRDARPSKMPPAATTGIGLAASMTCGTSTIVLTSPA
jgi:hypothetical protein